MTGYDELWAVVVAGGRGVRLGGGVPKQFRSLGGRPLLAHTLDRLSLLSTLGGIVLVLPADLLATWDPSILGPARRALPVVPVAGGTERADSVRAGLAALPAGCSQVLVHDAVRPCLDVELLDRLDRARREIPAVIPGIEIVETVKEVDERGWVVRTLPRSRLRRIQTPQIFDRELLVRAFETLGDRAGRFTDCASMVEALGIPVRVVEGDPDNVKVTTPEDWDRAGAWLDAFEHGPSPTADGAA